jgi:hypothetical protein
VLRSFQPEVIAVSVRNIDNVIYQRLRAVEEVVAEICRMSRLEGPRCFDLVGYDMSTVVFRPRHFSPEDLQERYNYLNHALYSFSSIARRPENFKKNMIIFVPQNLGFRQAWKGLAAAQERHRLPDDTGFAIRLPALSG